MFHMAYFCYGQYRIAERGIKCTLSVIHSAHLYLFKKLYMQNKLIPLKAQVFELYSSIQNQCPDGI